MRSAAARRTRAACRQPTAFASQPGCGGSGSTMMVNFDSLQDGSLLQADLCIIGAGAAGLLLAHAFVGTGTSVVVAESGERVANPRTQALYCGQVDGRPFRGLQDGRVRSL